MTALVGPIRLLLAAAAFALGLLAVFRAPHAALWKPAVAATEWGHVLALLAVPLLFGGGADGPVSVLASALALGAVVLLASPVVRARPVALAVEAEIARVVGPVDVPMARPSALVAAHLFGAGERGGAAPQRLVMPDGRPVHLHLPGGAGPWPLLVALHGGSWNSGDPDQLPALYRYLARRGIAVAAITYRLVPAHTWPAQLADVQSALGWLREQGAGLGVDPDRMALFGRSAGGQLALAAAYREPALRGVVAYYAPSDFHWSWSHPTNPWVMDSPGVISAYLGGTPREVRDSFDEASPVQQVSPGAPPTLLLHGVRDELVFHEQSVRLQRVLAANGVPHVFVSLPWATHGCDANLFGPSGQISVYSVERFLHRALGQCGW